MSVDAARLLLCVVGLPVAAVLFLLGLHVPAFGVVALLCLAFSIDAAVAGDGGHAVMFAVLAALMGRRALTTGGAR